MIFEVLHVDESAKPFVLAWPAVAALAPAAVADTDKQISHYKIATFANFTLATFLWNQLIRESAVPNIYKKPAKQAPMTKSPQVDTAYRQKALWQKAPTPFRKDSHKIICMYTRLV